MKAEGGHGGETGRWGISGDYASHKQGGKDWDRWIMNSTEGCKVMSQDSSSKNTGAVIMPVYTSDNGRQSLENHRAKQEGSRTI